MPKRNMEKIIGNTKGTIKERFDMTFYEITQLLKTRKSIDLSFDSFVFGYAQGMKAAKAEMKKRGKMNE